MDVAGCTTLLITPVTFDSDTAFPVKIPKSKVLSAAVEPELTFALPLYPAKSSFSKLVNWAVLVVIVAVFVVPPRPLDVITTFLVIKFAEIVSTPAPPSARIEVLTVLKVPEVAFPNHFRESLPVPRLN